MKRAIGFVAAGAATLLATVRLVSAAQKWRSL
jgi:hypothetical protein